MVIKTLDVERHEITNRLLEVKEKRGTIVGLSMDKGQYVYTKDNGDTTIVDFQQAEKVVKDQIIQEKAAALKAAFVEKETIKYELGVGGIFREANEDVYRRPKIMAGEATDVSGNVAISKDEAERLQNKAREEFRAQKEKEWAKNQPDSLEGIKTAVEKVKTDVMKTGKGIIDKGKATVEVVKSQTAALVQEGQAIVKEGQDIVAMQKMVKEQGVIAEGASGKEVEALQRLLQMKPEEVDGVFGPKTKAALVAWQKKNGLANESDGILGSNTIASLAPSAQSQTDGVVPGSTPNGMIAKKNNGQGMG